MNSIPFNSIPSLIRAAITLLLVFASHGTLAQQARYIFSADGSEVTDIKTGLIWMRCSVGQRWNSTTCVGTATEITHEQALAITKSTPGWRLPNVKELSSLVDTRLLKPAIYSKAFPNTSPDRYWTSSGYAADATHAWAVNFDEGTVLKFFRKHTTMVRLVR